MSQGILGWCQLALGLYWRTEGGSQSLTGIQLPGLWTHKHKCLRSILRARLVLEALKRNNLTTEKGNKRNHNSSTQKTTQDFFPILLHLIKQQVTLDHPTGCQLGCSSMQFKLFKINLLSLGGGAFCFSIVICQAARRDFPATLSPLPKCSRPVKCSPTDG